MFYWGWGFLLVLTGIYLGWLYRKKHPYRRWSTGIRFMLLGVLLLFHQVAESGDHVLSSPLFLLIDTSQSMQSRLGLHEGSRIGDLLQSSSVQQVLKKYPGVLPHYYDLSDFSKGELQTQLDRKIEWKQQSLILSQLELFLSHVQPPQKTSLVILTDTQDTQNMILPEKTLARLRQSRTEIIFAVPLLHYPANSIQITKVEKPQVVFTKTAVSIEIELRSNFQQNHSIELILTDGKSILAKMQTTLAAGEKTQKLEMSWTPVEAGDFLLRLQVGSLEISNSIPEQTEYFPMEVRPQKLRVLHIAGRPSWDVVQLRTLLKTIPEVDLVSFYILREPQETVTAVADSDLALIRFPMDELFQRELFKFDRVIFHDFAIQKYLSQNQYQKNFQNYLLAGHQILVVVGDQMVDFKRYENLFVPPEKQPLKLLFQTTTEVQALGQSGLDPDYLRRQTTFTASVPNVEGPVWIQQTSFGKGLVTWIEDPALWHLNYPVEAHSLGQGGGFAAIWQGLLYQKEQQSHQIFRNFEPSTPYFTKTPIEGLLDFRGIPYLHQEKLFLEVVEQQSNQVFFRGSLKVINEEAILQIASLPAGFYQMHLFCECSDFAEHSHPIRVIETEKEWSAGSIPSPWLRDLIEKKQVTLLELK